MSKHYQHSIMDQLALALLSMFSPGGSSLAQYMSAV